MLNRLKISLILAPLSLTLLVGVYIYSLWSEERERRAEIPFDSTDILNRDLIKFQQKRGSFPEKLADLEGVVWERKERSFASEGRSLVHRNYYYLYSRVGFHQYSLWAIPVGNLRDESSTNYLLVSHTSTRKWKGPPISLGDLDLVSPHPNSREFAILGMIEQTVRRNRHRDRP